MAASKPKKEVFEKTRGAFGKKGSLRRAFLPFTRGLASFAICFIFVAVQKAQGFSALGGGEVVLWQQNAKPKLFACKEVWRRKNPPFANHRNGSGKIDLNLLVAF